MTRTGDVRPAPEGVRIDGRGAPCKGAHTPGSLGHAWFTVLLVYLVGTLALLVAGAPAHPRAALVFLPLHVLLTAWTWRVGRGRGGALGDWTFPLALPLLYAELPLLMEGLPGAVAFHDGSVAALEAAVFGGQPAFEWAAALPVPWVSELLHLGYLSYYPLILLPPALLWVGWTGPRDGATRREAFHRTILALTLAMLPAFALMVFWPVQGPRYLGPPPGIPGGPVRELVLGILEAGSSRGAAFPSSHVSLAVAQALVALRWQRPVGLGTALLAILLAAGAIYGGFHYALDVVAGAALGSVAAAVALGVPGGPAPAPHPPDAPGETPPDERG